MRIALIQQPPVFLDLAATMQRVERLVAAATQEGADLVVFAETWLPGYPVWLDEAPDAALWDHGPAKALFRHLRENSPSMDGDEVARMVEIACRAGCHVVMGLQERDGGTLYNSMLFVSPDGHRTVHRKLVPTYTERLVWGRGDGSGLVTQSSEWGPIGGLVCWEHWMPLARAAMHAAGEFVHVAQWPWVREMHQVASRQYAFEGCCFVAASGCVMTRGDVLEGIRSAGGPDEAIDLLAGIPGDDDRLLLRGGGAVIAPDGAYVVGPVMDDPATIFADLDPGLVEEQRMTMDVDGHYSRPDVFTLHVNRDKQHNVE
jgi:predicted amidohydrolase